MIRVGFDISQIAHLGGVANYTENLAFQLQKESNLDMVFFYSSLRRPYVGELNNVKKYRFPPTLLEIIFHRYRKLKIEKLIGNVDIFHSSDWIQPKTDAKKITTYHDVVPLKYPKWSHPKIIQVHKKRFELVKKDIDKIIAVSKSTKKDLVSLGIDEKKIVVIYEAAGKEFHVYPEQEIAKFKQRYNLPEDFILAIGGIGTRRNLKRVHQASKRYRLIVAGVNIPYLSYSELPLLYNSAKILLYPSFYEGFGLPILEAMSCGLPVITSNVSSMPEVGGDAAEYVNPESVVDIENKLGLVMKDQSKRDIMIKKGFEQAKKFSWEKCADETLRVYKEVMKK